MLTSKRPFLADEELGKKDDDHQRRTHSDPRWQPKPWKAPRRRRILLGIVILYLLYLFFKNMPTDVGPVSERLKPNLPASQQGGRPYTPPPPATPKSDPPPRGEFDSGSQHGPYYEGKLHFYELGKSLKLFQRPAGHGGKTASSATIFAAARLESVSDLLPLACRMANQKLNEVHFLLVGRDNVSVEGIQRVNGIDRANCPVNWHDARVDYAPWSTDARMEQAVATVLPSVQAYLRPQVVITHGDPWEEPFFLRGIQRTRELEIPHITLPHAARDLMWMATLDSNALRTWNDVHVEFLIYAAPDSAGSFIRLIRSLEHADLLGFTPSLTIELPSRVDSELLRFLKDVKWPSNASSKVTVRRRIQRHQISPAEASLHAIEAFYPRNPALSHVLALSPEIELAPSFFHYLIYTILKYKHSTRSQMLPSRLIGISLELPSSHLTNAEPFKKPDIDKTQFSNRNGPDSLPLFLSQAPNSNAALYFGDKWVEIHSFLAHRLATEKADDGSSSQEKIISSRYPAYMEYLLELIRAKGYYVLYPGFFDRGRYTLATLHDELFQYPEEFSKEKSNHSPESLPEPGSSEKLLSQDSTLMAVFDTFSLELPDITRLPILSYRGEEMSDSVFSRETEDYLKNFRVLYGGCPEDSLNDEMSTELFCGE